jgi:hypothetical protein
VKDKRAKIYTTFRGGAKGGGNGGRGGVFDPQSSGSLQDIESQLANCFGRQKNMNLDRTKKFKIFE